MRPLTVPPSPLVELEISSFLISAGSASSRLPLRSSVYVPTKAELTRFLVCMLATSPPLPPDQDPPNIHVREELVLCSILRAAVSVSNDVRIVLI